VGIGDIGDRGISPRGCVSKPNHEAPASTPDAIQNMFASEIHKRGT
jgi:hypothetical protein